MFFRIGDAIKNRENGDYGIIDGIKKWGDYICRMVNGKGEYTIILTKSQMELITPCVHNEVVEEQNMQEDEDKEYVVRVVSISNVDCSFPETDTTLITYYHSIDGDNFREEDTEVYEALSDEDIIYEICDYFGIDTFTEHHENHDLLCFRYRDKCTKFALYKKDFLLSNHIEICDFEGVLNNLGLEVIILHKIVGDIYDD